MQLVVVPFRQPDRRLRQNTLAVDRFNGFDLRCIQGVIRLHHDGRRDFLALHLLKVLLDFSTRILVRHVELGVFRDDRV
jgi:hypothetical protein